MEMEIVLSGLEDLDDWLILARQVEHLFGPMVDDPYFKDALRLAISVGNAFCIRGNPETGAGALAGGIIISRRDHEIMWLAVSESFRGLGLAGMLIEVALTSLDPETAVYVQTFDKSVPEGKAARGLYRKFGFVDQCPAETNPAGFPTVIMRRDPAALKIVTNDYCHSRIH